MTASSEVVGALALTVVRAGARDSLNWWDDDALTEAGSYALAKVFPRNPARIAVSLALRAARARHAGVFTAASINDATTLLDLIDDEPSTLERFLGVARGPIGSAEELRMRLVAYAPEIALVQLPPASPEGLLEVEHPPTEPGYVEAVFLAAGYLAGDKGRPVFPFFRRAPGAIT